MATITANAVTGNSNVNGTWSGGVQPTAADDVVIPASAVITIPASTALLCRSLTVQASGTLIFAATTSTVSIGDATAGAGNVALNISSTATITLTGVGVINFVSTSSTQQTITSGGKTLPSYTINGAGSSYQLADNNTTSSSGTVTLTTGTFDTNGKTCSWGFFSSSNTNTRTLTLGASAITINSQGAGWDLTTTTGLTFNPGTSSITYRGGNSNFNGGGLTYYSVSVGGSAGTMNLNGTNTFTNLTTIGSNSGRLNLSADQTVTGLFTGGSDTSTTTTLVQSTVRGTKRTITAASVSISNVHFQDIGGAGGAAPFATTNTGDMGGNTGITFPAGVTRYWVATSGGSYMATTSWSTTSGGASGASIPLPQDTAVFDANSITSTGRTITINAECVPTLDFTGLLNNPTISVAITNGNVFVRGDLVYSSAVTPSGTTAYQMYGRGGQTITLNTVTLTNQVTIDTYNATVQLGSNFATAGTFSVNSGTFTSNNYTMTVSLFSSTSSTMTITINLGTSTVNLTSTAATNVLDIRGSGNFTWNISNSTFVIATASANQRVINASLGAITFGNLDYSVASSSGILIVQSSAHSFNNITMIDSTQARTIKFLANVVFTVRGNITIQGAPGVLHVLSSTSGGTRTTFSKSSGVNTLDYASLQDILFTGGAAYYATNSTNTSNNAGIAFYAQPAGFGNLMSVLS